MNENQVENKLGDFFSEKHKEVNAARLDIFEFGYYIEKDGKRVEPLSKEWFEAIKQIKTANP